MIVNNPIIETDIINEHPCFSEKASLHFGRIHLPVAPRCNIQCNYCDRKYDCVNESRPGVSSQIITPQEAVSRIGQVVKKYPYISVAGIAGPGDPLCNEETFETLRIIKDRYPHIHLCLSTNGLLLPDKIDSLKRTGVETITITLNAVDPLITTSINSFIWYHGEKLTGIEAARTLLCNQLTGIEMAVNEGITVKVNTVVIPTVNDNHIVEIAMKLRELGVYIHNIMPLIPLAGFSHLDRSSPADMKRVRDECAGIIPQMTHCRQCRADAVGFLSRDMSKQLLDSGCLLGN